MIFKHLKDYAAIQVKGEYTRIYFIFWAIYKHKEGPFAKLETYAHKPLKLGKNIDKAKIDKAVEEAWLGVEKFFEDYKDSLLGAAPKEIPEKFKDELQFVSDFLKE